MTPRIARSIVIGAAAVAVLVAATGQKDPSTPAEQHELALRYLYSPDATRLLVPLIDRFNDESHRLGEREIQINGIDIASGLAEVALAESRERAVLWTPASTLWGSLLNHSVSAEWVPAESPSLVSSTQVIAMWRTLAQALGWPRRKIGWEDIVELATSRRGWAERGHPEYGPFLLGHTNPGYSTSGLSAVASDYYVVTGKRSRLTLADVMRPDVRAAVQEIEGSIAHYGEIADKLLEKMAKYGRGYAHAAYVQETTLRKFNQQQPPAKQLVPITPADGTFVADYPLITLAAPWVSSDARAAAAVFRRWLVPKITAENASASSFDLRRPSRIVELEPPNGEVLAAIQDAWHEDRKPANIALVVDTSASMDEDGRLEAAKQALRSFLRELSARDRVALVTSRDSIPLGALRERRPAVSRAVDGLFPSGDEPIYPAVSRALGSLRALDDPDRINAIVVLSDGAGSTAGRTQLLRTIAAAPVTEGTSVRIFTVAYGKPPDAQALRQIAEDSDGAFFEGGPRNIGGVYLTILSYF